TLIICLPGRQRRPPRLPTPLPTVQPQRQAIIRRLTRLRPKLHKFRLTTRCPPTRLGQPLTAPPLITLVRWVRIRGTASVANSLPRPEVEKPAAIWAAGFFA